MVREFARKVDAIQERVGRFSSWLMLTMVLVVFFDVVARYGFQKGWVFMQELEWHLFGMTYLLAAGYTLLYDEHVRVDVLYNAWPPRKRARANVIFSFVFFFPSVLLVMWTTIPFLRNSLIANEGSPDPGGMPARWALKSVIIIGFLLLTLQGVSQCIKNYYVARGWEEPETRVKEVH